MMLSPVSGAVVIGGAVEKSDSPGSATGRLDASLEEANVVEHHDGIQFCLPGLQRHIDCRLVLVCENLESLLDPFALIADGDPAGGLVYLGTIANGQYRGDQIAGASDSCGDRVASLWFQPLDSLDCLGRDACLGNVSMDSSCHPVSMNDASPLVVQAPRPPWKPPFCTRLDSTAIVGSPVAARHRGMRCL